MKEEIKLDFNDPVYILHRYFIWANRMRIHFDEVLKKHIKNEINNHGFDIESMMYMSLWYGLLYVVIEGWKTLKIQDVIINNLLTSPNTEMLKEYRNAVFHYSKKRYYDNRFEAFYKETTSGKWARELNSEFSRFFLGYFKNEK